jgi:hypothetical protein
MSGLPGAGQGQRPARRRITRIEVAETLIPRPWSLPLIRTHPHRGLSLTMRSAENAGRRGESSFRAPQVVYGYAGELEVRRPGPSS